MVKLKDKRGQVIFYTLMLSIIIIVITLAFAPIVKQFIMGSRGDLDCSNPSISDWDKGTCYFLDIIFWLMICFGVGLAIVVLGAKVIGK